MLAYPNGAQGSHILTSLLGADALAHDPRRRWRVAERSDGRRCTSGRLAA